MGILKGGYFLSKLAPSYPLLPFFPEKGLEKALKSLEARIAAAERDAGGSVHELERSHEKLQKKVRDEAAS